MRQTPELYAVAPPLSFLLYIKYIQAKNDVELEYPFPTVDYFYDDLLNVRIVQYFGAASNKSQIFLK
jgi:hypothetical protein